MSGLPNDTPLADLEVVDALPWWVISWNPDFWIIEEGSDFFQVEGIAYICPVGFEANDYDTGTNASTLDCATAIFECEDPNTYELDWTKFTDYGFVETRAELYYDEWDYWEMDIDWWDMDEITDELYDDYEIWYIYDITNIDTWFWMYGDLYYNWEDDKMFMCIDPTSAALATGEDADPNDNTKFETEAFLAVWEVIEMSEDSMIIYEYYYDGWYGTIDAYLWSDVTADDFYGSFAFGWGDWACDADGRVWDCWADGNECMENAPGAEGTEYYWELTSY